MDNQKLFFQKIERLDHPATILFRSIEVGAVMRHFGKILHNNKRTVVDLGCGEGIITSIVFPKNRVIGIDNDPEMAIKAERSKIFKKVLCTSAASIPVPDNSVDLIFSNSVFEHIADLDASLSEVLRILKKKSGRFVFTVPLDRISNYSVFSRLGLWKLSRLYGACRDRKFQHINLYSRNEWSRKLIKSGFQIKIVKEYLTAGDIEMWDGLLILFTLMRIFPKHLRINLYYKFIRNNIFKRYLASKEGNIASIFVLQTDF